MGATTPGSTRAPKPDLPRPEVAVPTVVLAAASAATWVAAVTAGATGAWSLWATVPVTAFASFAMFTVLHDAAHRGTGRSTLASEVLGRFAMLLVVPFGSFPLFRWLHLTHHGHVNEGTDADPDDWVTHGPLWKLVPRWPFVDLHYLRFWAHRIRSRPAAEIAETLALFTAFGVLVTSLVVAGYGREVLLLWVLPHRITMVVLAWWFDYLPHHGLQDTNRTNRYATTRTIVGGEWLLTPLLFSQNYHALHHIHPIVPFYRYVRAWRQDEEAYVERGAPLVSPAFREVDPEEHLATQVR